MKSEPTLREWLKEAPFTLGLSAGFFGFFAHTGLVRALEEARLIPSRMCGASAGALVAGFWSSGLDAQAIWDELRSLTRRDFWDPWPGPGLLRGRLFRRRLERLLPVDDFAGCRWPLRLSAHDILRRRTRVLDSGPLAPAIHASCAVPFLFHPVWIGRRPLADGGISDRPGLHGLPWEERLFFHHLPSTSRWRRTAARDNRLPKHGGCVNLIISQLPRPGPFQLEAGYRALEVAYRTTREALDRPVRNRQVNIEAR